MAKGHINQWLRLGGALTSWSGQARASERLKSWPKKWHFSKWNSKWTRTFLWLLKRAMLNCFVWSPCKSRIRYSEVIIPLNTNLSSFKISEESLNFQLLLSPAQVKGRRPNLVYLSWVENIVLASKGNDKSCSLLLFPHKPKLGKTSSAANYRSNGIFSDLISRACKSRINEIDFRVPVRLCMFFGKPTRPHSIAIASYKQSYINEGTQIAIINLIILQTWYIDTK
jgi:hypothetical protein